MALFFFVMKKIFPVLFLLLLLLISCSEEERGDENLNIAISQDVASLDVMKSTSRVLRDILVGSVYEKLFVLEDGAVKCELASSYDISEDGRHLSIKIRDDVMMHDGSVMDSHDVAASLNRYLSSYEAASEMVGAARFSETEDGVEIFSERPLYLLVYLMASSPQSAVIASAESLKENEYGLITEIVGTGPYMFSSFNPGVDVCLKRFPSYSAYGEETDGLCGIKHAYFDNITFNIVPDATTRRLGLERGDYDYINDVMSYDIPSLSENEEISLLGGEESGAIALVFNKRSPLSSSLSFRKAVASALDYDGLMKACYGDYGYSIHTDYMEKEQQLFSLSGDPYLERDLKKAEEYLAESGYEGQPFRILTSNLSNMDRIAVAAESMLREVGINVEIIVQDWVGFLDSRNNSQFYDMFISAFSSVCLPTMKLYLSSTYPGWYESEVKDELLASISSAKSIEEASELWKDAQVYFWNDLPVIVPGHYSTINASSATITGIIIEDGNHFWNAERKVK